MGAFDSFVSRIPDSSENKDFNSELTTRLELAQKAYRKEFGKDLPITSKVRTREEQKDLYKRFKKGESGIYMPLNPDEYPNQKTFHNDAVDISSDVSNDFLKSFGLHRPLGKNDPVHTTIDPSFKAFETPIESTFTSRIPEEAPVYEAPAAPTTGFYNPNLVRQGQNAAPGGGLQNLVENTSKELGGMSWEDWKKNSLTANAIKYGASTILPSSIFGDWSQEQKESQKKLQEAGQGLYQAFRHPLNTISAISEQEPGTVLGGMLKGGVYDAPLALASRGVTAPLGQINKAIGLTEFGGKLAAKAGEGVADASRKIENLQQSFSKYKNQPKSTVSIEPLDLTQPQMVGGGAANVTKESAVDAILPDLAPETQAFVKSQDLNKVNLPALETKALEEKHGIKLSKGQRTEDVSRYADEWNHRADNQKTQDLFTNQPEQFKTALENIKEKHTPNLGDASGEDFGQNIMNAYASNDIQSLKNIENAYLTMKSRHNEILQERGLPPTSGMPLNTNQFVTLAKENLIQQFLADDAEKAGLTNDLKRIEQNGLTFPEFVAFDKKLSRIQRSGEGGQKAAAKAIKDAFDEIPLENGMEELSPMLQNAKQLAKQRFDKITDIPGYKFSIENMPTEEEIKSNIGSKNANKFYNTFINNASTGDLKRIKLELENHPKAIESIAGAELEKIVKKAGFTGDMGKFTPKNLNDYLVDNKANLSEKLNSEALNDLMEINVLGAKVAKPDAGVFNHSNSLSGLFSDFAKQGIQTKAEAALAGKTGGMSILPIGIAKKAYEFMNKDKFVNETIHPHSGLIEEKP